MKKEKSFERKEELLNAALDEFIAYSYEDASLNRIIKNARISKGTFYYHFADKQSLYLYLLQSSVNAKVEYMQREMTKPRPSAERDIFEQFKLQARFGIEFALAYPNYYKLGQMFNKEKGKAIYAIAKDLLGGDTEKILEGMIDKAIGSGNLKNDFPREFIIKTLTFLFVHFDEIFSAEKDSELEKLLRNLDNFVDFIKCGLGK